MEPVRARLGSEGHPMTLLTDEERAKLVDLEKAATPGPWERQPMSEEEPGSSFIVGSNLQGLVGGAHAWPTELDSGDFSRVEANADLIAAARNALPALLAADAAVREMREALEKAEHTLLIASRMLTEDHKMVLRGKRWGEAALADIRAAIEKATKP